MQEHAKQLKAISGGQCSLDPARYADTSLPSPNPTRADGSAMLCRELRVRWTLPALHGALQARISARLAGASCPPKQKQATTALFGFAPECRLRGMRVGSIRPLQSGLCCRRDTSDLGACPKKMLAAQAGGRVHGACSRFAAVGVG